MSGRVTTLDRVVVALVGLVLLAGGLLAVDWRAGLVLDLPDRLQLAGLDDATHSSWWPWVAAVVGVVLGLLGLRWLVAHLPGRGPAECRLPVSGPTGTVSVDLRSLGRTLATELAETGPLDATRSTTARIGGREVVEVRGRLTPRADLTALATAVERCRDDVQQAFDGTIGLRVLVDAPGRGRRTDDRVDID